MSTVHKAMHAVMAELCAAGISKDQFNQGQKFKFRGIDDVYSSVAPLLVKHNLLIFPDVQDIDRVVREREDDKVTIHTVLKVAYRISHTDGSTISTVIFGEAADSGDKGVAKALSMAYKYLIFQAFCVPTEGQGHDPDAETVEFKAAPAPTKVTEKGKPGSKNGSASVTEAQRLELVDLLTKAKVDVKLFLEHYGASGLSAFPADKFTDASGRLKQRVGEAEADAALAGNSAAATDKPAESQSATAGAGKAADAGSASGAAKPAGAKVGPKVSRFRGVR